MSVPNEPPSATGPRPVLPDLSDLIANPGNPPGTRTSRNARYAAAAVGVLVLLAAGFGAGYVVAPRGPATLAAAVQRAESGALPCGTPATSTTGARGGTAFLIARLCQPSSAGAGATTPGGLRRGGLGGPGSVNGTLTAVSNNSVTVQTRGGPVSIKLPPAPKVTKTTVGSVKDLASGERVVVSTTQDGNGNRTASTILVLPASLGAAAG